jgi:MATE family multidrug resistance protein
MVGQLGHVMVGLADSIMIGKLGTIPLAAGAFANSIFIVPMVFGIGMAFGLTTPVANADGQKKPLKVRSYLKHGLYLNVAATLLIFTILLLFSPYLNLLGQDAAVVNLATSYFVIISSSLFPLLLFLTFKQFAEGLSDTRVAMAISIGANLINMGLNYLLIYGHFGLPVMGLNGAGYATLIARILMAVAMGLYVFKKPAYLAYTQAIQWFEINKSHFKAILNIGVPSGLQYIFEVSAFAAAAVMMGWIDAENLAAHQIAISLASVSYMAATGFGAAANVRVSNQLGAQNLTDMHLAARTNFIMTLGFMVFCGFIFFAGRFYLPTFYSEEPAVLQLAANLLIVAVFFQIFDGIQVTALGALRGLSETRIPTLITLFTYWGVGLPASYFLGIVGPFGGMGVWYGLAIGLTIASILLYWRFESQAKKLMQPSKLAMHVAKK